MKEYIGNVILNYEHYLGIDLYSDGQVEDELLDIVQQYSESEFDSIIPKYNKWPISYHLSHTRSNIIEWIPINETETVLEIGAGCGAITGVLATKANTVTCIELSKKRSLINAYRNRERSNIEILVGNFEDIGKTIKEQYDYVTLIGVFEYAESYISSENAYVAFLKKALEYIKPTGKLIIAIENKLGMKYWAGCAEDHVGRIFEGIEGYALSKGVKTFTRYELEKMFELCGALKYDFYYPYPDYKFPECIYSDEYLPKQGELNNNRRNLDNEHITLFDEKLAFDNILKNNLFSLYSNSYLIVIEKDGK